MLIVLAFQINLTTCPLFHIKMFFAKKERDYFGTRKRKKQRTAFQEWRDAIIAALIAAAIIRMFFIEVYKIPSSSMENSLLVGDYVFVSKLNYGPRLPITPLAFPFTHQSWPIFGGKSYSSLLQLPYKRLPGLQKIQHNEIVVFNYPMEEDVPVDRRTNFIKRCMALPGDTISIHDRHVYLNGRLQPDPPTAQYEYLIHTNGTPLNTDSLKHWGVSSFSNVNMSDEDQPDVITMTLSNSALENLKRQKTIEKIDTLIQKRNIIVPFEAQVFPQTPDVYAWNRDNFGPLQVPRKGQSVAINLLNIPLYRRIIEQYEHNKVEVNDSLVFINGQEAGQYEFKMDYYFMMGDNRHDSSDSRYWGFVPEDHIVGKAQMIWYSIAEDNSSWWQKIRFDRLFMPIK